MSLFRGIQYVFVRCLHRNYSSPPTSPGVLWPAYRPLSPRCPATPRHAHARPPARPPLPTPPAARRVRIIAMTLTMTGVQLSLGVAIATGERLRCQLRAERLQLQQVSPTGHSQLNRAITNF